MDDTLQGQDTDDPERVSWQQKPPISDINSSADPLQARDGAAVLVIELPLRG